MDNQRFQNGFNKFGYSSVSGIQSFPPLPTRLRGIRQSHCVLRPKSKKAIISLTSNNQRLANAGEDEDDSYNFVFFVNERLEGAC